MIHQGVIPLGGDSPGGRFPRGKDPPWPNGRGRGSRFLAVAGSNPPSPLLPISAKSWPRCCLADFGSRIKISAHPLGRSTSFFEPDLFRWVPGSGGLAEVRPNGNSGGGRGAKPPSPPAVVACHGGSEPSTLVHLFLIADRFGDQKRNNSHVPISRK